MAQGEIPKKLKSLRSELRQINGFPWDNVAKWTQKTIPFFMTYLPEYITDFRRVTTPPNPTKLPKPAAVLQAGPQSREYQDIELRERAADHQNCNNQRGQILSFLEGLIDVGDRLEQRPVIIQSPAEPQVNSIHGDNVTASISDMRTAQAKGPPIFISHASRDTTLVDDFADLLQLTCGLQQSDIFCTSIEGMNIPNGLNFVDVIRQRLVGAKVVIFILSRAYFDSHFCLTELGATWALATRPFFLLVPPIDYDDLKGVLQNLQATRIIDAKKLTSFWEELQGLLGITGNSAARWEVKRDEFLKDAQKYVGEQPDPVNITVEEYNAVQAQRDDAMQQLKESFAQSERLSAELERMKNLKDKAEVEAVEKELQPNNEIDQYGALLDGVRTALFRLPEVTKGVMFKRYSKGHALATDFDSRQVREEQDSKFIFNTNGVLRLNEQDPGVKAAITELDGLHAFLKGASEKTTEALIRSLGFIPELDNKRFWEVLKGLEWNVR